MVDDLSQYKDLYLQTSREYLQSLNTALLKLEKKPADKEAIEEIFRSAHSLKGQSVAMGYEATGSLCHTVEDIFYEIREGRMKLTPELADLLFASFDSLTASIDKIEKEGKELDLLSQTGKLKGLTGVKTVGTGKSERGASSQISVRSAPIKTIDVKVEQLDEMMNLMEELLVSRLRLRQLTNKLKNEELQNYSDQSEKILEALQFQIMKARTVPVKLVFDHFPRAIRDLARKEKKQVEFKVEGEDLELDRTIVDRLDEPLIHLLRNAVSHGIEKSGTISLSAKREKDYAVISVKDNGRGVDWQAIAKKAGVTTDDPTALKKLLFSGVSTAKKVTQVSGRGVGLQVVKKMVDSFGGSIDVSSEKGKGTTLTLKLPLTLAIAKAILVQVGQEKYAIPALAIDRSIKLPAAEIKKTADQEAFVLDEHEIPLLRLADAFGLAVREEEKQPKNLLAVIVGIEDERVGLVVDEIVETLEIIIKPVPEVLKDNRAFAGTTILGDGKAALILNPAGLI